MQGSRWFKSPGQRLGQDFPCISLSFHQVPYAALHRLCYRAVYLLYPYACPYQLLSCLRQVELLPWTVYKLRILPAGLTVHVVLRDG